MTDAELIQLRYAAASPDVHCLLAALRAIHAEYDAREDVLRIYLYDVSLDRDTECAVRVQYCDDAAIDRARFGTAYDVLPVSGDPLALLWAVSRDAEVEAIWRAEVLS